MEKKPVTINLTDGSWIVTDPSDEHEFMHEIDNTNERYEHSIRVSGTIHFQEMDNRPSYSGVIRVNLKQIVTAY